MDVDRAKNFVVDRSATIIFMARNGAKEPTTQEKKKWKTNITKCLNSPPEKEWIHPLAKNPDNFIFKQL